jgi:hypothetical protein
MRQNGEGNHIRQDYYRGLRQSAVTIATVFFMLLLLLFYYC